LTIPSLENNFQEYPFWASQLSSVNSNHIKNHIPNLITEEIIVDTITLNKIIEEYNIEKIDLLHTDTEGHDFHIIMNYNFKIKPTQIMFEHKHMDGFLIHNQKFNKLIEHLDKLGYSIIYKDTEDTVVELKL
jgi:siderophore synthetase component